MPNSREYERRKVVKLCKTIRDMHGWSAYRMAKELEMPIATYQYLEGHGANIRLEYLSKLKRLSGLSWKRFGELIEQENEQPK